MIYENNILTNPFGIFKSPNMILQNSEAIFYISKIEFFTACQSWPEKCDEKIENLYEPSNNFFWHIE